MNVEILQQRFVNGSEPEESCPICENSILASEIANVDCCKHTFCIQCIRNWTKTQAEACPQCKKQAKKLIYRDITGKTVEEQINQNFMSSQMTF